MPEYWTDDLSDRVEKRPRPSIDWIGIYVWALVGASVIAAVAIAEVAKWGSW
jgi:hypothetical protein